MQIKYMRKLFVLLLCLCLCFVALSQKKLIHWKKYIPDPRPERLVGIYALDTLISGYWVETIDGMQIYPVEIGYRSIEDVWEREKVPFRDEILDSARVFFLKHPDAPYYEDRFVRVFVERCSVSGL